MAKKIWLGDKLVDANEAKVSVFDHGLLYGDGVFEGIRVYKGRIFEFEGNNGTFTHALFQDITYNTIGSRWKMNHHLSLGQYYETKENNACYYRIF